MEQADEHGGDLVTEPSGAEAAAGDDELFAELYPSLRRCAAVLAPLDLDPDDLLQEAVTRVLRAGPLHRLDHPSAYLRRTMTNVVANHNRSRGRERRALRRVRAADDAVPAYPSDLADLERLDPLDRAAVFLADVERLPLADVAAALGVSVVAARARVSRARRRLTSDLSSSGSPSPEPSTAHPDQRTSATGDPS